MPDIDKKITIAIFSNKKLVPAFQLVERLQPIYILFSDWSFSLEQIKKNIKNIWKADIVYFHSPSNPRILLLPLAKILGKKTMMQWIGGDVLIAIHKSRDDFFDIGSDTKVPILDYTLKGLKGIERILVFFTYKFSNLYVYYLKLFVDHHVACAPHLSKDLEKVHIQAPYLPLVNHVTPELLAWPEDFSVVTYLGYFSSSDTKDYYGWNTVLRLAKDFSDLTIYAIGSGQPLENVPENVKFLGFVNNIKEVLVKVKGVLRISYYDGTPRLLLEALATSRYVAHTREFPCCDHITNYQDAYDFISKLQTETKPNSSGYAYMLNEYHSEKTTAQYLDQFHHCLKK